MHLGKVSVSVALLTLVAAAACGVNDDETSGSTSSRVKKDPAGNNGTVKIQEAGLPDEIPDNDPHVGCVFNIEFRGFDLGAELKGTWKLSAHPPSGTGTVVASGEVGIGEDSAGGAVDLDALVTVDLRNYDLSDLYRHPQQGYHLKLEVHADGSIGADKKHKVFWVDDCHTPPPVDAGAPDDAGTPVDAGGSSSSSSSGGSSGQTW